VWRARDEVLGRTVAVKVLAGRYADDPDYRDRIRDEARAAAALSHPNVAQVYDYGEAEVAGARMPYVVMELVRGGTLQDRLAGGPVPPRYAMRVCAEVAAALAAAHADGLVHRDIKPANVMLTPEGAKVVDFGIAAIVGPAGPDGGEVIGTPAYLAPERLINDAVEPASDVYALGVLLYRLLAGHAPWSADTTTQMLSAHIYVEPEPLAPLPDVPDYVIELCNRCLQKDPTRRPSAREAAALLAHGAGLRVTEDEPAPAATGGTDKEPSVLIRPPAGTPLMLLPGARNPSTPPPAPQERPARTGWRRRRLPVAVAALLAVAGTFTVLFLPDNRRDAGSAAATVADPRTGVGGPAASPSAAPPAARRPTPAAAGRTTDREATPAGAPIGTASPSTVPVGTTTVGNPPPTATPTRVEPSATATRPPPPPKARTLSSAGGTVRAICPAPATAQLLSWKPKKSYRVDSVNPGPAAVTSVVFMHGSGGIRMIITCHAGVPRTSNESF
jgi:hypothetical protein